MLRLSRGGMTIALWSGVSFGVIVASQYGLVIPRPEHWGLSNAILPLPGPRYAFYSVSVHIVAFVGRGPAHRLPGPEPAPLRHEPARRVDGDRRSAGLQPARHRQHDGRPGGDRRRRPHPHVQPRRRGDHRPPRRAGPRPGRDAGPAAAGAAARRPVRGGRHRPRPARDLPVHAARRPAAGHGHHGRAADDVDGRRLSLHVPGRHRAEAAGARGRDAEAAGRGRPDGRRHRPRDPQPAGLDVRLDAGAAPGARAASPTRRSSSTSCCANRIA